MSFTINVVHADVVTTHDVLPSDTVRMLRARMGLTTEGFKRGRLPIGLDVTFEELGVAAGATLTYSARSAEQQAKCRLRAGSAHRSSRHPL